MIENLVLPPLGLVSRQIAANHLYTELITDYLDNVEGRYQGIERKLYMKRCSLKSPCDFKTFFHCLLVTNLAATLVYSKPNTLLTKNKSKIGLQIGPLWQLLL